MPFSQIRGASAPCRPATGHIFLRGQTPVWVFVSFCLLVAAFAAGGERAQAHTSPQIVAAGCSQLLVNGGFEVTNSGWQTFGAESPPAYTTSPVFAGEQAMRLGIVEGTNLAIINGVRQTVFLPNSAASLVLGFHYRPIHESLPGDDLQYLDIYDANAGTKLFQLHAGLNNSANWIFHQYDLTPLKGKNIRVEVGVRNDGGGGRTALIIDDLSLLSCDAGFEPTVTPTGLSALPTPTPTSTNTPIAPSPTASASVTATPTTSVSVTATASPTAVIVTPATPTPIPTGCVNVIENGGFEQPLGSSTGWLPGHIDPVGAEFSGEQAEGLRSMQMGNPPGVGTQDVVTYSSIRQFVEIPSTASTATLIWKHQSRSQEGPSDNPKPPQDRQELILLEPNLDTKDVVLRWRENVPSWQETSVDLTKYVGESFYIYFNVFNDANSTRTWMYLDDVRLFICYTTGGPTATPTPIPWATETPTPIVLASETALADPAPGSDSVIGAVGVPTARAVEALEPTRTAPPVVSEADSPLWRSFLGWLSNNRIPIFVGLLGLILVVIFALRR